MNVLAFLFALTGAAFNMFQPVISTPASGSVFTGSMYDAFIVMINHISKNGLPGGDVAAVAMLILMVLVLIPIIATVQGLCILFRKGRYVNISLFLCAIVDGFVAAGIYYVSQESFSSAFFTNYITPYAQKISFITPAIWAVCYLIASIFAINEKTIVLDIHQESVSLAKGNKVDLRKITENILNFYVGLGWKINTKGRADFDLDASAFMITANEKVARNEDFIFYRNLVHTSGAIVHSPDEDRGGNGIDDDEWIAIDLSRVPDYVSKIVFTVTIHEADKRGQNFGQISSAFIRVADADWNDKNVPPNPKKERFRYDLRKRFSTETAIIVGELHRNSAGSWGFTAKGEAVKGGLRAVCRRFGVNVD